MTHILLANHADTDSDGIKELVASDKQMMRIFRKHFSRVRLLPSSCFVLTPGFFF